MAQRGVTPMMEHVLDKGMGVPAGRVVSKVDIVSAVTLILGIMVGSVAVTVTAGFTNPMYAYGLGVVGGAGVLTFGAYMFFSKTATFTAVTSVIYAVLQGLAVGGFTFGVGESTLGDGTRGWTLVAPAVGGAVAVFFASVVLYALGIIRLGHRARSIITSVTLGFVGVYAINFVFTVVFGHDFLMGSGPLPMVFSLVAIVVAALNVVMDTENCDRAIRDGYPSGVAWGLGASLAASFIWMYVEILRFLYLNNR